jgi:hypothetical protein
MPVSYRVEGDVLRLVGEGQYELDELFHAVDAGLADPELPERPFMLSDLSASRAGPERSPADVRRAAHFFASRGGRYGGRIAVLAPQDLIYGLIRMTAAMSEVDGLTMEAFRTEAEAMDWLRSEPGEEEE